MCCCTRQVLQLRHERAYASFECVVGAPWCKLISTPCCVGVTHDSVFRSAAPRAARGCSRCVLPSEGRPVAPYQACRLTRRSRIRAVRLGEQLVRCDACGISQCADIAADNADAGHITQRAETAGVVCGSSCQGFVAHALFVLSTSASDIHSR